MSVQLGQSYDFNVEVPGVGDVSVFVAESSDRYRQRGEVLHTEIDADNRTAQSHSLWRGRNQLAHCERGLPASTNEGDRYRLNGPLSHRDLRLQPTQRLRRVDPLELVTTPGNTRVGSTQGQDKSHVTRVVREPSGLRARFSEGGCLSRMTTLELRETNRSAFAHTRFRLTEVLQGDRRARYATSERVHCDVTMPRSYVILRRGPQRGQRE